MVCILFVFCIHKSEDLAKKYLKNDYLRIVLGGAISNEGDYLLKPLREKVTLPVEIHLSELKNNAGVLGAAAVAAQIIG